MDIIVAACVSQFHDSDDEFELLLAYDDGREIGHAMTRAAAKQIAEEIVNALGDDSTRQAEVLQRENAELREALKPFARHKTADGLRVPNSLLYIPNDHPILFNGLGNDARATATVGDIRRARALLGGSENAE